MAPVTILLVLILIVSLLSSAASVDTFDRAAGVPEESAVDEKGRRVVYDFIVVGAGASGSVVAARLAKETNKQVLLIEGGAKGTGQRSIGGTDYVASDFKTDPVTGERGLDEPLTRYDVILMADSARAAAAIPYLNNTWPINSTGPYYVQTKNIGGNQATNGGVWFRPLDHDLDNWGVKGYNSTTFRPYLDRAENASDTGYTVRRGTQGSHNVRVPSFIPLEYYRFTNASAKANYKLAGDINNGTPGIGIFEGQQSSKAGIREASAGIYLPGAVNRSNLAFRTSATVTRVLFSGNRAIGVELVTKRGKTRSVYALGEVILAAGPLQIPKILYYSGIGPQSVLQAIGVTPLVVNNIIGQKIRNHQRAAITYSDPTLMNANFFSVATASVQYSISGTGPFDRGGRYVQTKVNPTSPIPDITINAGGLAGSSAGDIYAQRLSVTATLTRNRYANGTLTASSPNPLAPTLFTANVFTVEEDARDVARGFMEVRRIMKFWDGNATEVTPGPTYDTVEKLIPWIRTNGVTACHYYGSVPMGDDTSPSSPCNPRWRVRGVRRLRIVGPSVIPAPVNQGMQAMAVALGEKGTDLIKEDFGL